MSKNLKSSILANMVVLIIAWICSNSFVWDLIYKFSPCDYYIAYQFLASSFFTFFSIMVTKDSVVFSQFWDKHLKMKKLLDIIIHAYAVFSKCYWEWLFRTRTERSGGKSERES